MITTSRCLLYTRDERMITEIERFEAIEVISDTSKVEKIWSFNKTPIIFGDSGDIEVPSFTPTDKDFEKKFTSWANAQGIDPGEMLTGRKFNSKNDSCILCGICNYFGLTTSTFVHNKQCKNIWDIILYESPSFAVVSELGALKLGFLMIVPKRHILSVAQFSSELYREYRAVSEDIEKILIATFGTAPVAFFEHGSGPSGMTSHPKSIVHAHVHVLHGFAMQRIDLERIQARPLEDITRAKTTHYFAYRDGSKGKLQCVYDDRVYVPRQYGRQIVARDLRLIPCQYNWRNNQFKENIEATLYLIWHMLASSDLGKRINKRTECFVRGYGDRKGFSC